jgi:Na+/proline symporter
MSPYLVFAIIAVYFSFLIVISYFTGRKSNTASFYNANKQSPWFLVAFGMIGASLSGVTFISIPGEVGVKNFYYFQIVLGYLVGYFVIATVLMPLYYRLNLITIYTYLDKRFGRISYKTGSAFFLISRLIGSSLRLFLVAVVLYNGFFKAFGISFEITVLVTIALIWVYTFKAGIKTIVWTDTLQTFFMLTAVVITIIIIANALHIGFGDIIGTVRDSDYSKVFDWDWRPKTNFFKQFFAGAFIAIVMTGLDQDMMQKNLTCKTIKDAQKNMFWFSIALVPVNLLFLSLGALLFIYANQTGIAIPAKTDFLYPMLAFDYFTGIAGIVFMLGIIAAAYSSADSALTALTSAFSIDFLKLDVNKNDKKTKWTKQLTHIGFSILMFLVIIVFHAVNDESVISSVFTFAGYTYGPLLGLFAFGLYTKRRVLDKSVPFLAILSPVLCYFLSTFSEELFNGYKFGFELLIVNGFFMFMGMLVFSSKSKYLEVVV